MSDQLLPAGQVGIPVQKIAPPDPKPITKRQSEVISAAQIADANITEFRIKTLEELEIEHIEKVLGLLDNNKYKAAVALGVTTKTLYNKLHAYGLFEKYQSVK